MNNRPPLRNDRFLLTEGSRYSSPKAELGKGHERLDSHTSDTLSPIMSPVRVCIFRPLPEINPFEAARFNSLSQLLQSTQGSTYDVEIGASSTYGSRDIVD